MGDTEGHIFSIGHSNHAMDVFLELLKKHRIDVLVDVRSRPYAKYASHFDQRPLREALTTAGIRYLFLGRELGGQPAKAAFYDADGHVIYQRLAESPLFIEGIQRLETGAPEHRIAIMCSEEDPASCHRRLLLGHVLEARGIPLDHIRGDGRVQTEEELVIEETGGQGDLFADQEDADTWKRSTQSVLPKKPPSSSSRP
jgi:uncharacterized protein (DUF488 family)